MAGRKINANDFADSINLILADYKKHCENVTYDDIDRAGTVALKKVKELAPVAKEPYKRNGEEVKPGKYKKSWRKKTEGKNTSKPSVVIYASGYAYLVHLLENGHAKRGGGRVKGYPHVAPAQEAANEEVLGSLARDL